MEMMEATKSTKSTEAVEMTKMMRHKAHCHQSQQGHMDADRIEMDRMVEREADIEFVADSSRLSS